MLLPTRLTEYTIKLSLPEITSADVQSITEADFLDVQGPYGNSDGYQYGQDQGYGNAYGNGGYA